MDSCCKNSKGSWGPQYYLFVIVHGVLHKEMSSYCKLAMFAVCFDSAAVLVQIESD